MVDTQIFEPDSRAISYVDEGEGPVTLVLASERTTEGDGLGVIAHYLAEEAGFRVVRIGARKGTDGAASDERIADILDVLDHTGVQDAWIGGFAAGSAAAAAFASAHTERVNGLLLLGTDGTQELAPGIPVLIIQAENDDVAPPAIGERLQATAPERATARTIPGADHFFPATHPIETGFIIEEYLDWD